MRALLRFSQPCVFLFVATDFSPFVDQFSPRWAKIDLHKEERTMLPQAMIVFA
jgi:hypothetical protein